MSIALAHAMAAERHSDAAQLTLARAAAQEALAAFEAAGTARAASDAEFARNFLAGMPNN
jgi:hypothetical protein